MLTSPYLNSVTFKNTSGIYPNRYNRLHSDRKQGGNTVMDYCQKYPNGHTIILQFISESPDDVSLNIYGNALVGTLVSSYAASVTGDVTRYWFNFELELTSEYHNSRIFLEAVQGADKLTSEPIHVSNLSELIEKGDIVYFKYTNLDRINSDLDNRFVNWAALTNIDSSMDLFVEGILIQPNDTDDVELIDGSQQVFTASSVYFSGNNFQSDRIPDYLATKLGLITSLDEYSINGISYAKPGSIEIENIDGSTFQGVSISLTEKISIGLNVDNTDEQTTDIMEWHKEDRRGKDGINPAISSYTVIEPDGYLTLAVMARQIGNPVSDPIIITFGYDGTGTNDIGQLRVYNNSKIHSLQINRRKSFTSSSTIYIGIPSVAGNSLEISFNFQLQDI